MYMSQYTVDRRRLLQLAGGASVVALAGCADNGDDGGPGTETVTVGTDGNEFDPATVDISTGTTVTFVWEESGHNIAVESQPDGSDWDGVDDTQDEGFEHEHTFETAGTYEYVCEPHAGQGMTGTITVGEGSGGGDDGGDDGGPTGY